MGRGLSEGAEIGPYIIQSELGAGGFGITYVARDSRLDRKVAVKEFFPGDIVARETGGRVVPIAAYAESERRFLAGRAQFLTEARTLAQIDHPNIVRIITFLEANNTAYIVMDFVNGRSLADAIESSGPFKKPELVKIFAPLMDAIEAIHAVGLLHRDIKPENILLKASGAPVIIDFGTARAAGEASGASNLVFTPGFAAPEQYSLTGNEGPWTDIYALSAVGYSCLTCYAPPAAPERERADALLPFPKDLRAALTRPIADAIEWGLALRVEDRPRTVAPWRSVFNGTARRPSSGLPARPRANTASASGQPIRASGSGGGSRWAAILVAMLLLGGGAAAYVFLYGPPAVGAGSAEPRAVVDSTQAEADDFAKAQAIGSPEAYVLYLRLHPNGKSRAAAEAQANGAR